MTRAVPRRWVLRQRSLVLLGRFGPVRVVVTVVLLLGWLAAVLVAVVASDADLTCTPADPSVCGPDVGSAWIGLALATPVLLCWRPRLGVVAGVLFALAEIRYDPDPAGHLPFAAHGVLCLLGFAVLPRVERARRSGRSYTSDPARTPPRRRHPYFDDAEPLDLLRRPPAALVACGLLLAAVVCLGRYAGLTIAEHHHVADAVQTVGTVADVDSDDYSITLRLTDPDGDVRESGPVDVLDTDLYPPDASVPVLIDPHDDGWARLVAEPQDATGWLVVATFLGALGVAVGLDRSSRRRAGSR